MGSWEAESSDSPRVLEVVWLIVRPTSEAAWTRVWKLDAGGVG